MGRLSKDALAKRKAYNDALVERESWLRMVSEAGARAVGPDAMGMRRCRVRLEKDATDTFRVLFDSLTEAEATRIVEAVIDVFETVKS